MSGLPEAFAATLRQLRADRDPRLNAVLAAAHNAGWTYALIASALEVSHQAVRQRAEKAAGDTGDIVIPAAPVRTRPVPDPPRQRPTLDPRLAEDLRQMHRVARTVNGATPSGAPERRVSEQFTRQLAAYVEQGMSTCHLAEVLGCDPNAVRFRLGRHGYRRMPPSQAGTHSGVYKNRSVQEFHAGRRGSS